MSDFYYKNSNGVVTLHCRALDEIKGLSHCFTTRQGGISTGHLSSMNLSFSREERSVVEENYRRLCQAEGFCMERMTLTDQTHTARVRLVDERSAGMGMSKESDIRETDGLITSLSQTPLAVFVADCAPILMCDTITGAIAAVHSGWRGTREGIAAVALDKMNKQFGTQAKDVIAAVGPCIDKCCYEVGEDFRAEWNRSDDAQFFTSTSNGKYLFDLKGANRQVLEKAGVGEIYICKECTCCQSELLFSHRATKGKRGNMAGIIQITKEEVCTK